VLYVEIRMRFFVAQPATDACAEGRRGSRGSAEERAQTTGDAMFMDFSLYEENEDYRQAYHPGSVNLFSPFTEGFRTQKAALDMVSERLASLEKWASNHAEVVPQPQPVVGPEALGSGTVQRAPADFLVRASMVILLVIHAWHLAPALKDVAGSALRGFRSPASIAAA
jgi:hypothetical protein